MKNPNFLILDEPTNDLDIDTLNVLEEFLERYNGVLLLVSHDRYLMDRLTEQLFILEGEGIVDIYSGNYTDYRLEKEENAKKPVKQQPTTPTSSSKKKLSFKEQKELESLETSIEELEDKIKAIILKLNQSQNNTEIIELSQLIVTEKAKVDEYSIRWLELVEIDKDDVPRGT
jgi:ATP-binding cassette subfamily F protein uup